MTGDRLNNKTSKQYKNDYVEFEYEIIWVGQISNQRWRQDEFAWETSSYVKTENVNLAETAKNGDNKEFRLEEPYIKQLNGER